MSTYLFRDLGNRTRWLPKFFILTIVSLFCTNASGQDVFNDPIILNSDDGLPSERVLSIEEDYEGFMWFATDFGLCRYDGTMLESFLHDDEDSTTIVNDYCLDVLADKKNQKIWVATLSGVSSYDPTKQVFTNYVHDPFNPNSIPDFQAYKIFQDKDGNIWVGFKTGGILKYRPDSDDFERHMCNWDANESSRLECVYSVTDIAQDHNNDSLLWLASGYGIIKFNRISGEHRRYVYNDEDIKRQNQINNNRCIYIHSDGLIYYGTWWEGVFTFDPKSESFSDFNPCFKEGAKPFVRGVSLGFYKESDNEFWMNSTMGTQLYNVTNGCISRTLENTNEVHYAVDFVDKQNRIWCASRKLGAIIFNPVIQQFGYMDYEVADSEFPSYTVKILEDESRNRLYVAADVSRGLFIYDVKSKEWEVIPPPKDYSFEKKGGFQGKDMVFLDDAKNILIIENNSLYYYEPGFNELKLYPVQPEPHVTGLVKVIKDSQGKVWISAASTFLKLDVQTQELYSFEKELAETWGGRLGGDYMVEDKNGNIWIREYNGLLIWVRDENHFIYHPQDAKKENSMRGMGPLITDEKGRIWMATNKKYIGYAHADSIEAGVLKFYSKQDGLIADNTFLVSQYRDKILVFSNLGLQTFNPETRKFENYIDTRYGMNWGVNNATVLSDGRIAASMYKTITVFHPDSLVINKERPIPYVSAFSVFDKTWPLKGKPSEPDTVHLSYKQNFFSFEFSAIAYNLADKIKFEYKLEGIDEAWQDGTKRKFAAYTNVPGGDYRFLVRAINNEGLSIEKPSVTYLSISTVWWKTWWFWSLVALFLFGIGYVLYNWKIRQVRQEERLKSDYERKLTDMEMSALRAQMNPHFIFNSLNSIEYYIINNDPEKASDYLNRFSRLIRLILQNSKSSIVPLKDDLEALKLYIEMESMRFDNLFDYEVRMESGLEIEKISVPPMLLQPYVENAIWHGLMQKKGEKGKLDLLLRRSNGHLVCLIEDNGIGRQASQALKSKSAGSRKSFGMKITSDRINILNRLAGADATVQVYDLTNEDGNAAGTRVELVIPL